MVNRRLTNDEIAEIKQIPLADVLYCLELPVRKEGRKLFFSARWRSEKKASCLISNNNCYADFGGKYGNTVIDLVMNDRGLDFGRAVHWLHERFIINNADAQSVIRQTVPVRKEKGARWKIIDRGDCARFERDFQEHRRLTADDLKLADIRSLRVQHVEKSDMI